MKIEHHILEKYSLTKEQAKVVFEQIKPLLDTFINDQYNVKEPFLKRNSMSLVELTMNCYLQGLNDSKKLIEN